MKTAGPIRKKRNHPPTDAGYRQVVIRIPIPLHEQLKAEAEIRNDSISLTVVDMIDQWFDEKEGAETIEHKIDRILTMLQGFEFTDAE